MHAMQQLAYYELVLTPFLKRTGAATAIDCIWGLSREDTAIGSLQQPTCQANFGTA